jgi:hypothetical protein
MVGLERACVGSSEGQNNNGWCGDQDLSATAACETYRVTGISIDFLWR